MDLLLIILEKNLSKKIVFPENYKKVNIEIGFGMVSF